jgi:phosphate butyryltransferase
VRCPAPKKIHSLKDIVALAKRRTDNKRLALAAADTEEGLKCVRDAHQRGLIQPILVGDRKRITQLCRSLKISLAGVEVVDEPDPQQAAIKAVAMCRRRDADILMKGNVHTAVILRAILDRDSGLGQGGVLSNTAVFESPREKRLMFMADPAVNINPDVTRKVAIIRNAIWVANRLGFVRPKVAVLAPVEEVNVADIPATADAALIAKMGESGQIACADIAGPIPLDVAVNRQAAKCKNIKGPVAGRADILFCPEINSANVLYKALIHLAGCEVANAMIGVKMKTPLVMTSRSDSALTRLYTMALAVVLAGGEER